MPGALLSPLAIVQIVRQLDRSGGASGVAFTLAAEFRRRGLEVTNFCLYPPVQAEGADLGEVVLCRRLAAVCRAIPWSRIRLCLEVPLFTLAATRAARRHKRAVVLVHGDGLAGDVFVAHSCHWAGIAAKIAAGRWAWVFWPLHPLLLAREAFAIRRMRFRLLVAVSGEVGAQFARHHHLSAERILSIPSGVDRERFRPAADKAACRHALGLPEHATLLLFVGHQFATKGLHLALEGLALCGEKGDPRLLVIGGDHTPPYRALARRLGVSPRVLFLGRQAEVERYFAAADLLLLLSEYEAFGLVGLEALASGVPVLATRVGGIPEYLEEGVNGHFVERTAAAVAARLKALLADPEGLARLARAARDSTRGHAWSEVAEAYIAACQRLATARGLPGQVPLAPRPPGESREAPA
jgi:glycosyltransferase involved in cell wall biosynthesis